MSHAAHPAADSHAGHADHDHHGGGHHGHVIVPMRVLLATLGILLFFTVATVGLAQLEHYLAHVFNVEIPQWVNVFIALSIAAVKTTFVALYFMQLRYDSPVNSIVLVFTLITVVLFLGFTMIDLGNRGTIAEYKAKYKIEGGSGGIQRSYKMQNPDGSWTHTTKTIDQNKALAEDVRDEYIAKIQETIRTGGTLPYYFAKYEKHMREQIEELQAERKPLPEHLAKHLKFMEEQAHAYAGSGRATPPAVAEFIKAEAADAAKVDDHERPSPNNARVRTGFSPDLAPKGAAHGGAAHDTPAKEAPKGPTHEHKDEPAKPAH